MLESAVLEQIDAPVDVAEAQKLSADVFGVAGRADRLAGERDQNFRIDPQEGEPLLLKISNSAEDPAVTDLQTQALLHIAQHAPGLPVPRLYPTRNNEPQHVWRRPGGERRLVRLLSFLPGVPLHQAVADEQLLDKLGVALAQFDRALRDLRHPAETHDLLWDLQHASRLRTYTWAVEEPEKRRLAEAGLAIFSREAAPVLGQLRAQLLHNDLNPHNVLVSGSSRPSVTGIIDLGDMVRAPLVNDLAVAAAYHVGFGADPLDGVAALTRGYDTVLPLEPIEFKVLTPLIIGRLAMSVVISSWRARMDPTNRAYIFRNLPAAVRGLSRLLPLDLDAAAERLRTACVREPS
jgi:Ser/Thr protein kinase RdoA (MazF antagonist)